MRSQDPFRVRLARLTQRSQTDCQLADPLDVTGSVLLAPPQGEPHPSLPDQEIWPAATGMTATARAKGAAFVDRRPFEPSGPHRLAIRDHDRTGCRRAVDDRGGAPQARRRSGRVFALFGDADWNHLTIQAEIQFDRSAGIGVALPQTTPGEGLFAALERTGAAVELAIYSRIRRRSLCRARRSAIASAPGPETAIVLSVDAFDDRLRVTALDTVVEVDRNAFRDGRVALFGEGEATFASLASTVSTSSAFPSPPVGTSPLPTISAALPAPLP